MKIKKWYKFNFSVECNEKELKELSESILSVKNTYSLSNFTVVELIPPDYKPLNNTNHDN